MGPERFELSTPALSEQCSNQLSYRPIVLKPYSKVRFLLYIPSRDFAHDPVHYSYTSLTIKGRRGE
jgi:NAD kinase